MEFLVIIIIGVVFGSMAESTFDFMFGPKAFGPLMCKLFKQSK